MKTRSIDKTVEDFRHYLKSKGYSPLSIASYVNTIRSYLYVNPGANGYGYKEFLASLEQKSYRPLQMSARKTMVCKIKKYYDFLLDTGQREDHPCRGFNLKGNIDRSVIHSNLFTMAELELMFNRQGKYKRLIPRNKAITSLLIYQAMTVQEIVRLKVSDIDMDAGVIHITGGLVLTSRTLEIKPKQYSILYDYINNGRKHRLKCKTESFSIGFTGMPDQVDSPRTLVESLRPLFPDRKLNPMSIRDSVISYWLNELKLPLEQVQLMAGHRWISCTERYLQVSMEEQKEILKKFHPLG